ncbi:MAG: methenyltetrahydromethanopterin cyclohydrolase [Asgard group archaeon]|nr:methenyltetrahydromethanopterin cyclohydrolase [Asgard group archaeon]
MTYNSLNLTKNVQPLVKKLQQHASLYQISSEIINDATIIDCGIHTKGSYSAGLLYSKITLGGLAQVTLSLPNSRNNKALLPKITVTSSHPVLATLGCQAASWTINKKDFFGMACGPGRILAQKPSSIFEMLAYNEESDQAIICLEADVLPPDHIIDYLSKKCSVEKENITILTVKTASLVECIQMAARPIELGIFKLVDQMGYPKEKIISAIGTGLMAPLSIDKDQANNFINNGLIYGTELYLIIQSTKGDNLPRLIKQLPSCSSSAYGQSFQEVFEAADRDFSKFDLSLLAPTKVTLNDIRTGRIYSAGKISKNYLS